MVGIPELWLSILLAAVFVFIASTIVHMVLKYHWKDYRKLPAEDGVMDAVRQGEVPPGDYAFPCPEDHKEWNSPELKTRFEKGPVGFLTVRPNGFPNMGKHMGAWFLYCVVVGVLTAYLTGRVLGPGAEYLSVFRIAGTAAFMAYGGAHASYSIWKGQCWGTTFRHTLDALIYGLVTGGAFGWLWP